jgi:hypothetical protein
VCRVVGDARKPALNTQQRRSAGFSLNTNNGGKKFCVSPAHQASTLTHTVVSLVLFALPARP